MSWWPPCAPLLHQTASTCPAARHQAPAVCAGAAGTSPTITWTSASGPLRSWRVRTWQASPAALHAACRAHPLPWVLQTLIPHAPGQRLPRPWADHSLTPPQLLPHPWTHCPPCWCRHEVGSHRAPSAPSALRLQALEAGASHRKPHPRWAQAAAAQHACPVYARSETHAAWDAWPPVGEPPGP
jgi:hypothetical protein